MNKLIHQLDRINEYLGRGVAFLALLLATVVFLVVVLRYGFQLSSQWLSESILYVHGGLFMLGVAYTLQHDGHVRVDVISRRFSPRGKAFVELFGTLVFLWPVAIFLLVTAWPYVSASWSIHEGSHEPGGIPFLYLLKTLLLIMPSLLFLQGTVEALKALQTILGRHPETVEPHDVHEGI